MSKKSKITIELTEDQRDIIVIDSLKESYQNVKSVPEDKDAKRTLKAIKEVLEFYGAKV